MQYHFAQSIQNTHSSQWQEDDKAGSRARLTSWYSGHHTKTLGTTNLTCVCKNVEHNVQFFVTEMDSTAILGVEACQRLGLIQRSDFVQLVLISQKSTQTYIIEGIRLSSWRIQNQARPKWSTCGTCSEKGTSSTPWSCQGRTPEDGEWWRDQEARRANRLGEQHGHCRNTQETESA